MRSATADLAEALKIRPDLGMNFKPEQMSDILAGNGTIFGLTWHHHEDGHTMQLVDRAIHGQTGHSGGRAATGGRPRSRTVK